MMDGLKGLFARYRKILIPAAVFLFGVLCVGIDNGDVWFMDVHAEDMLENGLAGDAGQFTAIDGLSAPYQKWAMCLLVRLFLRGGSYAGAMLGSALFCGMFALAAYFCSDHGGREGWAAGIALMATFCLSVSGSSAMLAFRPHVVAACLCMLEARILERQVTAGGASWRAAAWLSLCSLAMMWFHSTMWVFCFIPVLPYLAEALIGMLRAGGPGPRRCVRLCLAAMPCMFLAGMLNPLGFGQLSYMKSVILAGQSGKYAFVGEMQPMFYSGAKFNLYMVVWVAWCVAVLTALLRNGARNVPARDWLFFLGSVALGLMSVRFVIYSYAFLVPLLVRHSQPGQKAVRIVAAAALFGILSFLPLRSGFVEMPKDKFDACGEVFDMLQEGRGDGAKMFTDAPFVGSVALEHGIRPFFDTRAEIYDGDLNGGCDILPLILAFYGHNDNGRLMTWQEFRDAIFDPYGLDCAVFTVPGIMRQLIWDMEEDSGIRVWAYDDILVCERIRQ